MAREPSIGRRRRCGFWWPCFRPVGGGNGAGMKQETPACWSHAGVAFRWAGAAVHLLHYGRRGPWRWQLGRSRRDGGLAGWRVAFRPAALILGGMPASVGRHGTQKLLGPPGRPPARRPGKRRDTPHSKVRLRRTGRNAAWIEPVFRLAFLVLLVFLVVNPRFSRPIFDMIRSGSQRIAGGDLHGAGEVLILQNTDSGEPGCKQAPVEFQRTLTLPSPRGRGESGRD